MLIFVASLAMRVSMKVPEPSAKMFASWGSETLEAIIREFKDPASGFYAETCNSKGRSGPAFDWGVGVLLSALNAATEYDPNQGNPKVGIELAEYLTKTQSYLATKDNLVGYDVLPRASTVDRYYDDNAWMMRDLCESYNLIGFGSILSQAQTAADFTWSGFDSILGGGIYWHELNKNSKNTASNAPVADGMLQLYMLTKQQKYLDKAIEVYDWTHITLRDPETSLYWDNENLQGKIDKTNWSYNTGLMIQAASRLYSITKDRKYQLQADQAESAAVLKWCGQDGEVKDLGKFAHLLLESFLVRKQFAPMESEPFGGEQYVWKALNWLHRNGRDPNGHYGSRWDTKYPKPLEKWALIDQASAARAYFDAANFLKKQHLPAN